MKMMEETWKNSVLEWITIDLFVFMINLIPGKGYQMIMTILKYVQ